MKIIQDLTMKNKQKHRMVEVRSIRIFIVGRYTPLQKFVDSHKLLGILSFTAIMLQDTLLRYSLLFLFI
ncbi:hypothetical protein ECANGB1_1170 [Enterospora canceri]|uniref:Uncharacterized protein n=1 Tax=Enterospora canceri TaxID=1081671 RepID=A0A1Y1S6R2_9MICR|nr:hypothetical protein ECANGB1_1170 [Enterospora canceri]